MGSRVYVGTVGSGVWSSNDLGETWESSFSGFDSTKGVWSMAWHDAEPETVFVGTEQGLVRHLQDGSVHRVASPFDERQVWALAQSSKDCKTMYVGTRPGGIFRSCNGGDSWDELPVGISQECQIGKTRVTRIRIDPLDEGTVWVSVEIDAVHVSHDHGDSWEKLENGFKFPDIHDMVAMVEEGNRKLLAATAVGLYSSSDGGQNWEWNELDSPWQYTRGMELKAGSNGTVFLGNGDGPPGTTGRLLRSDNFGCSWKIAELDGATNSTVWNIAANESNPNLLFSSTILGQVFRSTDGGMHWTKIPREFSEIRSLLWHPI
ncbi:MAG: YCF48-related protein [Gammaproteobacteria bacterium]|nr:YCF48-related protein [Gammaproteobacteria bacterium]